METTYRPWRLEDSDPNKNWWKQVNLLGVKREFLHKLKLLQLLKHCSILSKPSRLACSDIKEKIDFLHLDGNFSEKGALEDVNLYLPKVKENGYILFSNVLITVHNLQPKKKAFQALWEACDFICCIDQENTFLFRKK